MENRELGKNSASSSLPNVTPSRKRKLAEMMPEIESALDDFDWIDRNGKSPKIMPKHQTLVVKSNPIFREEVKAAVVEEEQKKRPQAPT